jgi:hypothetical protein
MTTLNPLLDAAYLRRQADTCLRIARTTFDLSTAEGLRFLAIELRSKAAELDDVAALEAHLRSANNASTPRANRK